MVFHKVSDFLLDHFRAHESLLYDLYFAAADGDDLNAYREALIKHFEGDDAGVTQSEE